jgi:hypothetical protein
MDRRIRALLLRALLGGIAFLALGSVTVRAPTVPRPGADSVIERGSVTLSFKEPGSAGTYRGIRMLPRADLRNVRCEGRDRRALQWIQLQYGVYMNTDGLEDLRDAVTAGCPLTLELSGTRDHDQADRALTRIVSTVTLYDGVSQRLLLDETLVNATETGAPRWQRWRRAYDVAPEPSLIRAGLLTLRIDGFMTVECHASRSEDNHVALLISEEAPPSLTWQECAR